MEWQKPDQRFCDQYRSWKIMEEYFGVIQPGVAIVPVNLPEPLKKGLELFMDKFGPQFEKWQRERIAAN